MISPTEYNIMKTDRFDINHLTTDIDIKIIEEANNPQYPWLEIILEKDLPYIVREEIAKQYLTAGWNFVVHQTSEENGERAGLTSFVFCTDATYQEFFTAYRKSIENKKWYVVNRSGIYILENINENK